MPKKENKHKGAPQKDKNEEKTIQDFLTHNQKY